MGDQFEAPCEVGDEDTVGVSFGTDDAPFIETGIHLWDVVSFGPGVFGEADRPPTSSTRSSRPSRNVPMPGLIGKSRLRINPDGATTAALGCSGPSV